MPDTTLLLFLDDVRNKTLKMLDGLSDAQGRFVAPGLVNSILWHAGHSWVVNEHLGVGAATGKPAVYPDGWQQMFGGGSKPETISTWPNLADVFDKLKDQQRRLHSLVESLSDDQLKATWGDPAKNRTVRWAILHGLHDEANHQGEIWLLKKMQAKS